MQLDLDAIRKAPVATTPFPYLFAEKVMREEDLAAVRGDFPEIRSPGIFPLSELSYGDGFAALVAAIKSSELEEVMSETFGVDLSDKPMMLTVRGRCRASDGKIHTDTRAKVVTCLLYLNEPWAEDGGRLRLLRGPKDLDDVIVEIPPNGGTLVAFKRSDNSFHGHKPFEGARKYVMFNWLTDRAALERELGRHRFSASVKRLNPFG
jgi:hypothetical protein